MPEYKSDIDFIIDEDSFSKMFKNARYQQDKAILVLSWLTGGRPAEIMALRKKDIIFEEHRLIVKISTKKLGKKGKFMIRNRTLNINLDMSHDYIQILKRFVERKKHEDKPIFDISRRTFYNIINRIGYDALNVSICPYNFRHSRMTLLAEKGASKEQLKRFKGSRTDKSVNAYVHARKIDYDVEVEL